MDNVQKVSNLEVRPLPFFQKNKLCKMFDPIPSHVCTDMEIKYKLLLLLLLFVGWDWVPRYLLKSLGI
jgi:hypothetical protein